MTAPRRPFVAGNWKMNTDRAGARELASAVAASVGSASKVRVAVCPPFPYLLPVAEALAGSAVELGAQNCHPEMKGAYTGEVSPAMLLDVGCKLVILGHSERRNLLGETDAFVNQKALAALTAGLEVVLCVGEKLEERNAGRTNAVLERQLSGSLADLDAGKLARVTLAYEPVWAIGTGVNATPQQAQDAHAFIRGWIAAKFGAPAAAALVIQYGGSVKGKNAAELFACPDVDGGLIGGASLDAAEFEAIVGAASGVA